MLQERRHYQHMSCQGYIMTKNMFQRLSNTVLNGLKRTLYKVRRAYIAARVRDSCVEFGNVICNSKIQTWALQGTSL